MQPSRVIIGSLAVGLAVSILGACGTSTNPVTPSGPAVVLAENTVGENRVSLAFVGESIQLLGTGSFVNLRFSWQRVDGPQPSPHTLTAFGNLYLLDREYLGAANGLNSSTLGFIAHSISTTEAEYVFAPDVAVELGKTYWFYTDARGIFLTSESSEPKNVYSGGELYMTGTAEFPFRHIGPGFTGPFWDQVPIPPDQYPDANFRLTGTKR